MSEVGNAENLKVFCVGCSGRASKQRAIDFAREEPVSEIFPLPSAMHNARLLQLFETLSQDCPRNERRGRRFRPALHRFDKALFPIFGCLSGVPCGTATVRRL